MVKSREKFAEELGGGGKDYFVGRDHHWAAGRVITHEADIGECLIISKSVEDSLEISPVVGEMKQRTPHRNRSSEKVRNFYVPLLKDWGKSPREKNRCNSGIYVFTLDHHTLRASELSSSIEAVLRIPLSM